MSLCTSLNITHKMADDAFADEHEWFNYEGSYVPDFTRDSAPTSA